MATGFESALVKPIVDAFVALYKKASGTRLKVTAEAALSEAIRELLLAPTNLRSAEAKIAVAKAAGIINADLILAEEMVDRHRAAAQKATSAKRPAAKKAARARKPAAKKASAAKKMA